MIPTVSDASRILYFQGRNLGDAVIGTQLIETLGQSFPNCEITVLTRPGLGDIYRHNPHVNELRYAAFPLGSNKNFGIAQVRPLLRELMWIRRNAFDLVVNCEGGIGENVLAWLMSPRHNCGPVWPAEHPHRPFIRTGFDGLIRYPVTVPVEIANVYSGVAELTGHLGAQVSAGPRLYAAGGREMRWRGNRDSIGLHPLASQEGKLWPANRWRELVTDLRERGKSVVLFGATHERERLNALNPKPSDDQVTIETLPLLSFFEKLTEMSALVCLDSFAAHAAAAVQTPAIVLTGTGSAAVWTPPGVEAIDGGEGYPPPTDVRRAIGLERAMARIEVEDVVRHIELITAVGEGL